MRATHLLSRVLLALLGPGLGVTLQGPVGELGLSNTEQLERTVRDINRLEATLEKALPANLRAIANVSQNWSPLDEEQVRQEAEVNAAVADATREERRASEQLAAARAQAAAVGARRQVRRFVSAGMLSLSPPPPSPSAQTSQQLALEAQEAGRAALHAASLAMRMAALSGVASGPMPGGSTQQPQPQLQQQQLSEAEADARLHEAMDLGEALTFETRRGAEELERTVRAINRLEATTPPAPAHHPLPAATNAANAANAAAESTAGAAGAAVVLPTLREAAPLPPSRREESQPQPEPQPEPEPPTPPLAGGLPLVGAAGEGGEAARAVMRARLDARVGEIMRRVTADGRLPPPEAAAANEPPLQPGPRPEPRSATADGDTARSSSEDSGVGVGRTGYAAHWMVRGALWFYLAVLAVSLVAGGGVCLLRSLQMLAAARQRHYGSPKSRRQALYADPALGLSDGMDAASAAAAWQRRVAAAKSGSGSGGGGVAAAAPPPPPGPDSRVQDLLRSGKQNFSVSESRAVANFLARKAKQDDLLILCGKG